MNLQTYLEFESLVKDIFRFNNFNIINENRYFNLEYRRIEMDFSVEIEGKQTAVEVKYYRQRSQNSSLIKRAAEYLLNVMKAANMQNGILVISSYVHQEHIKEIESLGILVITRSDLFNMSAESVELTEKLASFLEDTNEDVKENDVIEKIRAFKTVNISNQMEKFVISDPNLCEDLKKIVKSKIGWKQYEEKCKEILQYLFNLDLTGWQTQQSTDDKLNRFDLVTRIRSMSDFWLFICNELKSRYVIFEFKNYREKIKQGQILTTEKYLHQRALRSVAFIISRKGASDSALIFAQGAMREHGKLIITLTDDDLCHMLKMKVNGDDPNDYMFDKVDTFLMTLPR